MNSIYTPRTLINQVVADAVNTAQQKRANEFFPQMCTKLVVGPFEISIGMDAAQGPGDLNRTEIRVFDLRKGPGMGADITREIALLFDLESDYTFNSPEDLMNLISELDVPKFELYSIRVKAEDIAGLPDVSSMEWLTLSEFGNDTRVLIFRNKTELANCIVSLWCWNVKGSIYKGLYTALDTLDVHSSSPLYHYNNDN